MRAFVFFFFAILAMAAAQRGVHVVDHNPYYNPNQVQVVDNNPEYNQNQVHVVDYNPEYDQTQVHVVDNNPEYDPTQVHVVDNNPEYDQTQVQMVNNNSECNQNQVHVVENSGVPSGDSNDHVVIANPDPFFSQPSKGPSGGYEPISTGPAFVQTRPYPYKQYDNPLARGGK